jgi:hypothetical protein
VGILLDPVIEIKQAKEHGHHERAVGESLAEGLLHGQWSAGIMRILGGLAMEWASRAAEGVWFACDLTESDKI